MNWKRAPFQRPSKRTAWPLNHDMLSYIEGDDSELIPANYLLYKARGGCASKSEFFHQDKLFKSTYIDFLNGQIRSLEIPKALSYFMRLPELRFGRYKNQSTCKLLVDHFLADITEDQLPDIGMFALSTVFGPFAKFANEYPPLRILAAGILALDTRLIRGYSPAAKFSRQKPRPSTETKRSMRDYSKAPPDIWVQSDSTYNSTFQVGAIHSLQASLPPLMLAKVIQTPNGHNGVFVLPIPKTPDLLPIHSRLKIEYYRVLRHCKMITWDEFLSFHTPLLYRITCEWLWVNARKETQLCWDGYFSSAVTNQP
jgi:hypothetical protein